MEGQQELQLEGYPHRCPDSLDELSLFPEQEEGDIPVRTLYDNWRRARARYARSPFLGTRQFLRDGTRGDYIFQTYEQIGAKVDGLASGLLNVGVKPGDRIGSYSINREEVSVGDLACYSIACPTVSLYDTLGEDSIGYVLDHAEAVAVFCSRDKLTKVLAVANGCKSLRHVIVYEDWAQKVVNDNYKAKESQDAELQKLRRQLTQAAIHEYEELIKEGQNRPQKPVAPKANELVSILYTSGTTGVPKGVMLTHANMISAMAATKKAAQTGPDDVHLSYLPLAHIYERLIAASGLFSGGRAGFYQGDVKKLVEDIVALKPTVFCGVPRVYQKVYDKIMQGVQASFWHRRQLFNYAYNTKVEARRRGEETPTIDRLVFSKIKERLGGRIRLMISGSAPLSPTLHEFLEVVFCCPVLQGYGLSETAAAGSVSKETSRTYGHVGFPVASNEIKLVSIPEMNYLVTDKPCPRGEILIRGPNVFQGYYKMPEQTAEVFTEDGWFRTGDVGRWNVDGTLAIIDRKKNIFKLSQGEYVAAEKLEGIFQRSKYIQQIFVYGDSFEDHLVAIVVPEPEFLASWAAENLHKKEAEGGVNVLVKHPKVHQLIADELAFFAKDAALKGFEYIQGFHIEPTEWTPETGLVTPTFKLKRPALKDHYLPIIKKLYEEKKHDKEPKKAKL